MKNLIKMLVLIVAFAFGLSESKSENIKLNFNFEPNIDLSKLIDFSFKPYKMLEIKGGSRGGSRGGGSFGGRRSSGGSSFGGSKSSTSKSAATQSRSSASPSSSFGGRRMMSTQQARANYGTPRKVEQYSRTESGGNQVRYNMNNYGGFSSGLMTGYMMGNMSWWMHGPAFFYSRPTYVYNKDGSYDVYPPTFSFGKFLLIVLVLAAIILIIRAIIKKRREGGYSQSSFN